MTKNTTPLTKTLLIGLHGALRNVIGLIKNDIRTIENLSGAAGWLSETLKKNYGAVGKFSGALKKEPGLEW